MTENEIGTIIIEETINLHKNLGPSLLKLTGLKLGEELMKTGITRTANGLPDSPLCAPAPLREKIFPNGGEE